MTANARQYTTGHRWAARYRRYPARTDAERLEDFDRVEQINENERNRHQ